MSADQLAPQELPPTPDLADLRAGSHPGFVVRRRQVSLLAYLLTRDVLQGDLVIDTKVHIEDGERPFDATLAVVGPLCRGLTPAAVEVALLLRREGLPGTVENLLNTSAHLAA